MYQIESKQKILIKFSYCHSYQCRCSTFPFTVLTLLYPFTVRFSYFSYILTMTFRTNKNYNHLKNLLMSSVMSNEFCSFISLSKSSILSINSTMIEHSSFLLISPFFSFSLFDVIFSDKSISYLNFILP